MDVQVRFRRGRGCAVQVFSLGVIGKCVRHRRQEFYMDGPGKKGSILPPGGTN